MTAAETVENEIVEAGAAIEATSRLYLLLSRCFSYPEDGFRRAMKDERTNREIVAWVDQLPFEAGFGGIPLPSLPQDELESEYINTFDLNPVCPLYEFVYREGEQARTEILKELLRFYEHFEIRLGAQGKDYPDHLVAELEFMAFLARKEADAVGRGRSPDPYRLAQRDFLERHLNMWVPLLDKRIRKVIREPFYKKTSSFMVKFIGNHLAHLQGVSQRAPS